MNYSVFALVQLLMRSHLPALFIHLVQLNIGIDLFRAPYWKPHGIAMQNYWKIFYLPYVIPAIFLPTKKAFSYL